MGSVLCGGGLAKGLSVAFRQQEVLERLDKWARKISGKAG